MRTISRQQRQFYKSCLFADLRVNQGLKDPKSHDFKMSICCRLIAFGIIEKYGPQLPFPHSSAILTSKHALRELRCQIKGAPFRVFYAFDPRRMAILLMGGNKTSDKRFYEHMVLSCDKLYDIHLIELKKEGLIL